MRHATLLIPGLLLSAVLLAGTPEDPPKAHPKEGPVNAEKGFAFEKESQARKKAVRKPSAARVAVHPGAAGPGLEERLKLLESENLRLRKELGEKSGSGAAVVGAESASPEGALAELKAGNARFVLGARTRSQMGFNDPALRQTLAKGQAPFAVIVTCSDSRLGENYIFDQELGRLFTIREAGNAPDTQGLASIEYAVEHLGSKLVVVLGHDSCGAVKAVLEAGPAILPGNLWSLQAGMAGLLESVPHREGEGLPARLGRLVQSNAERQARIVMERSPIVQHLRASGKLKVVPALYDLGSGKVSFLPEPSAEQPKTQHH